MKTQNEMMNLVPQKLREIEKEFDVEVLWAIESGSR
ncbi:TPA: nucleotidyltransferase domain-containing protein, partial [Streptococcus suis]